MAITPQEARRLREEACAGEVVDWVEKVDAALVAAETFPMTIDVKGISRTAIRMLVAEYNKDWSATKTVDGPNYRLKIDYKPNYTACSEK